MRATQEFLQKLGYCADHEAALDSDQHDTEAPTATSDSALDQSSRGRLIVPLLQDIEAVIAPALRAAEAELLELRDRQTQFVDFIVRQTKASGDRGAALHALVMLKEARQPAAAKEILDVLLARWPDDDAVCYEAVQFLRSTDQTNDADALLHRALSHSSPSLLREAIFRLLLDPDRPGDAASAAQRRRLADLLAFGKDEYARALHAWAERSGASALSLAERFHAAHPQRGPQDVMHAVASASDARRPFCLLRLGDGEGAFLDWSDWGDTAAMTREHRRHFARRWFGDPALADDPRLHALAGELSERLHEADVLGIPDWGWTRHELRYRNPRALVGCLSVAQQTATLPSAPLVTSTSVVLDMEVRGMVSALIARWQRVGLITSHASLPEALRSAFADRGVQVAETVLIPPAASDLAHTGYSMDRSHLHDAYGEVMSQLRMVPRDHPMLVSAGFLGKLYCLEIKRLGGIAIDVGSLTDLWLGHMTRPNFARFRDLILKNV